MSIRRKVLITAYVAGNLGDDLFIAILCQRYPNVSFTMFCPLEYRMFYTNIQNLELLSESEIYNSDLLDEITLQIMIGGSLFMQPKDESRITDKFNSVSSSRLSSNIPFLVIGANFGPYCNPLHYKLYNEWFSNLTDLCFRDKYSFNLFSGLTNVRWAPDIVFNMKLPLVKSRKIIVISCIYHNNRIGLSNYSVNDYYTFLAEISNEYAKKGYHIIFQSFCEHQQDSIAALQICRLIEPQHQNKVSIFKYNGDTMQLLKTFLQAEYVIGTRFHSIIISWLAQIPVYPIVYNEKTLNVLKDYGFRGNYANIDNLVTHSFDEIDYNRLHEYRLNCQNLVKNATQHFYKLDMFLK